MAIKSGLVVLVDSVRDYFDRYGVTANVSLGWRERTKQINQGPGTANRVVFTPSDPGGKGGQLVGTQQPGPRSFGDAPYTTQVRALFDWEREVTVSVWAVDLTNKDDDAAQIEATETLFEWVVRAVQEVAKNNARWGSVDWTISPVEHQYGREIQAGLTYRHPLFDVEIDVAYPTGKINKPGDEET